jgi:5-dehydro-4-deoxyglucarate dehydratase
MRPQDLKQKLEGIFGFVITPFQQDHTLDLTGLAVLVDRIAGSGVNVICCAGGVGEFYALTRTEFQSVVETTVRAAAGRVPVIAGVGHATRIACQWARTAAAAGADGLLINPVYFVDPSLEGLSAHYSAIGEQSGLGLIAFSTGGFVYNAETMERLAKVPEMIGLKDEIGNLSTFLSCRARFGDRFAWVNGMAETLVAPYFAAGARCFTTGLVNFAPQIPTAVYRYALARDYEAVERTVALQVRPIAELRAKRKGYSTAVIKEATALVGLPAGPCRLPLLPLEPEDRLQLQQILTVLNLLPTPDLAGVGL